MPAGMSENSKKNLKKGNPATQFKKGDKRSKENIEKQKATIARKKTFAMLLEKELSAIAGKNRDGEDITVKEAMTKKLIKQAIDKGDMRTIEFIRDTIGEKPAEKVIVSEVDIDVLNEVENIVNEQTHSD